ncbi:MAG TPA: redoxin domain-containing protein, partial [Hyphomonadaceae bacterium]|nr:redoxin domain-containing protein [Hyphomonadaceae bacterium]
MKSVLLTTAAAVVVAAAVAASAISAPAPAPTIAAVPERAANFQLTDTSRLAHELHYFRDAPAIVLMSQVNGGKTSRDVAAQLAKLQTQYKAQGVLFYAINSKDSRDAAAAEAKAQKFAFPVLMDELQLVGEQLGIQREGEIFVVAPKTGFKVAYHGTLAETSKAIDAVLAGKPVANPRVEVKAGNTIAFPERARKAEHAAISYSTEVAPIIQAKCVACHQEGGIAPFAMDSYDI